MSSRRKAIGIYRQRYHFGQAKSQYPKLTKAHIICLDDTYQDIACLEFDDPSKGCSVWLKCHPGREDSEVSVLIDPQSIDPKYRKWGFWRKCRALILPVTISAGNSAKCSIQNYQIDIEFFEKSQSPQETLDKKDTPAESTPESGSTPWSQPSSQRAPKHKAKARTLPVIKNDSIYLLDDPQPRFLERDCSVPGRTSNWRFSFRPVHDQLSGKGHAARVTWEAENHRPHTLQVVLPITHADEAFGVTCRVFGEALAGGYPCSFDNKIDVDRVWEFRPQPVDLDLQACIDSLKSQAHDWNQEILGTGRVASQDAVTERSGGHKFSSIVVHAGDNYGPSAGMNPEQPSIE